MEELLTLPGCGAQDGQRGAGWWPSTRQSGWFVDTHMLRLSRRLELTKATEPIQVEKDLMKILPQDTGSPFPTR